MPNPTIALIDNYDSFTYNLYHYLDALYPSTITVYKNNELEINELQKHTTIVLSPGPGLPNEAGLMPSIISEYYATKKILGICLGHQALGMFFGAKLRNLEKVVHGQQTNIQILQKSGLFQGINKDNTKVARYHSWVIDMPYLSKYTTTAIDEDTSNMACEHSELPIASVQFHPESILTPLGKQILANFFKNRI